MASSCCIKGNIHTGEPTGAYTTIAGVETYVAEPTQFSGRAILLIHDAFGFKFVNNQLLCDTFAAQTNCRVFCPDFLQGDAAPIGVLDGSVAFDFQAWIARQVTKLDETTNLVRTFASELRATHGVTSLGAIGYCWGAFPAVRLGATDTFNAIAVAHPSFVEVPKDIEHLRTNALFLCAEIDQQFPEEKRTAAQQILASKPNQIAIFKLYPGTKHGFAVRSSPDDVVAFQAAQDAKSEAVDFFNSQL
eukprot:GILK01004186.1.p1 GENE.GILK01004186.1~~GILK01004186.1.p1  ORF type:complete len:265 (-),score=22.01 GILK01004186.1:138-878(-)